MFVPRSTTSAYIVYLRTEWVINYNAAGKQAQAEALSLTMDLDPCPWISTRASYYDIHGCAPRTTYSDKIGYR